VSLRFQHVEPVTSKRTPIRHDRDEYKRNSLCAIFEYVEKKRRERLYGIKQLEKCVLTYVFVGTLLLALYHTCVLHANAVVSLRSNNVYYLR